MIAGGRKDARRRVGDGVRRARTKVRDSRRGGSGNRDAV